ncbi:hypothetical protein ABH981_004913 [Bradyrhizobium ottawaense]
MPVELRAAAAVMPPVPPLATGTGTENAGQVVVPVDIRTPPAAPGLIGPQVLAPLQGIRPGVVLIRSNRLAENSWELGMACAGPGPLPSLPITELAGTVGNVCAAATVAVNRARMPAMAALNERRDMDVCAEFRPTPPLDGTASALRPYPRRGAAFSFLPCPFSGGGLLPISLSLRG